MLFAARKAEVLGAQGFVDLETFPNFSESFRIFPYLSEPFRIVPNRSESFRIFLYLSPFFRNRVLRADYPALVFFAIGWALS